MRYRTAIYFGLAMLSLAGARPALAQPFFADVMPPGAAMGLVRSAGFEPVSRPILQGRHYVLRAVDPVGTNVRIVVDAEAGEIVSARPLDPNAPRYRPGSRVTVPGPYQGGARIANIPPGMEWGPGQPGMRGYPPGPGPVPGAPPGFRSGMPQAPVQGRTPLPRSRPVESAKAAPEPANDSKPPPSSPAANPPVPSGAAEHPDADAARDGRTAATGTAEPAPPAAPPKAEQAAPTPPRKATPLMPPVQPLEE